MDILSGLWTGSCSTLLTVDVRLNSKQLLRIQVTSPNIHYVRFSLRILSRISVLVATHCIHLTIEETI